MTVPNYQDLTDDGKHWGLKCTIEPINAPLGTATFRFCRGDEVAAGAHSFARALITQSYKSKVFDHITMVWTPVLCS
jgi:hypothetical protein